MDTNTITAISIILSGVISLLISWFFFWKSNRNAFKSTVLTPIKHIIDKPVSRDGYNKLYGIASKFETTYASKDEKDAIWKLVDSYYHYLGTSEDEDRTNSVMEYFESKIRESGINPQCLPAYDEATHTEVENIYYPEDFLLTSCDIKRIIKGLDIQDVNGMSAVTSELTALLKDKAKAVYGEEGIKYFDDRSLKEVVTMSESHSKYIEIEKKYHEMKEKINSIK